MRARACVKVSHGSGWRRRRTWGQTLRSLMPSLRFDDVGSCDSCDRVHVRASHQAQDLVQSCGIKRVAVSVAEKSFVG